MDINAWYLVAYDIADPRRLQRLHRQIRREGLAMQKSVFLVQRTPEGIAELMDDLASMIHRQQDDLRAYPVQDPARIRLCGEGMLDGKLLCPWRVAAEADNSGKDHGGWRSLTGDRAHTSTGA